LSGPSHAEEVARGMPTLVVVGSRNASLSQRVQEAFYDTMFRIYVQNDVIGIELGAAFKNVIAIGAGLCDGLKLGSNTKAALISRGLLEVTQLGIRLGANPNTFFGLSGLGDLVTTTISQFGRNLRVGRELGEGKKLKEILAGMQMVAEGVETTRSTYQLAQKHGVTAAIVSEIYKILFEDKDPKQGLVDLMTREAHEEMKQY
jgi:glycerol-3-phosphate dehydrogenase (NAD(P)+)